MPDLKFSRTALASLTSFDEFHRSRDPKVANHVLSEIERLCAMICEFPAMGRAVSGTSLRFLVTRKYRYRVIYRAAMDRIEILDVLHPKSGKS